MLKNLYLKLARMHDIACDQNCVSLCDLIGRLCLKDALNRAVFYSVKVSGTSFLSMCHPF